MTVVPRPYYTPDCVVEDLDPAPTYHDTQMSSQFVIQVAELIDVKKGVKDAHYDHAGFMVVVPEDHPWNSCESRLPRGVDWVDYDCFGNEQLTRYYDHLGDPIPGAVPPTQEWLLHGRCDEVWDFLINKAALISAVRAAQSAYAEAQAEARMKQAAACDDRAWEAELCAMWSEVWCC